MSSRLRLLLAVLVVAIGASVFFMIRAPQQPAPAVQARANDAKSEDAPAVAQAAVAAGE